VVTLGPKAQANTFVLLYPMECLGHFSKELIILNNYILGVMWSNLVGIWVNFCKQHEFLHYIGFFFPTEFKLRIRQQHLPQSIIFAQSELKLKSLFVWENKKRRKKIK
jgi:hypothetical protein